MASFIPSLLFSGLGTLGGAFAKPKPITTTSDQTSNTDMWNTPTFLPNQQELLNRIINQAMFMGEDEGDYWSGYTRQGMGNLAQGGQSAMNNIQNILTQRGIRGGAAGAALAMPQVQQQFQQSSFLNSLPQLIDQRRREILGQQADIFSRIPTGSHNYGSQTSRGTSTQMGGNLSTLGSMLNQGFQGAAFGYGMGNPQQQKAFGNVLPNSYTNRSIPSWVNPLNNPNIFKGWEGQ